MTPADPWFRNAGDRFLHLRFFRDVRANYTSTVPRQARTRSPDGSTTTPRETSASRPAA